MNNLLKPQMPLWVKIMSQTINGMAVSGIDLIIILNCLSNLNFGWKEKIAGIRNEKNSIPE